MRGSRLGTAEPAILAQNPALSLLSHTAQGAGRQCLPRIQIPRGGLHGRDSARGKKTGLGVQRGITGT